MNLGYEIRLAIKSRRIFGFFTGFVILTLYRVICV